MQGRGHPLAAQATRAHGRCHGAHVGIGLRAGRLSRARSSKRPPISFRHWESTGSPRNADAGYAAYEKGNYEAALKLLRPLAENGDDRAQSMLGLLYYRGRGGVQQNDAEALKWFLLAADRGNALAEFNLGVMHAEGRGVPQDNGEAARWYRLAADRGSPQAQYNLGLWYANGDGGSADNVRAHMWFNLAAARFPASDSRSRSVAANSRDAVAGIMTSEQIAEAQRLAREWKPK